MFDPNMPAPGPGQFQITSAPQAMGQRPQGVQLPAGMSFPQMPQMPGRPMHGGMMGGPRREAIQGYIDALRGWVGQRPGQGGDMQGWMAQRPQFQGFGGNQVAGQVSPMSVPPAY